MAQRFDDKKFKELLRKAHNLAKTDPDGAHRLEDALNRIVMRGIILGEFDSYETLRERAEELLGLYGEDFPRWYS